MTQAQAQYKRHFDKSVSVLPEFRPSEEIFLDRPPGFSATALENEDGHRRLLPRTTGPYRVIAADKNTITIDRDVLRNTVAIDRVTLAPPEPTAGLTAKPTRKLRAPPPVTVDPNITVPAATDTQLPPDTEFAIDRIVRHGEEGDGTPIYRVRWYGYFPRDDTWELTGNIPDNFLCSYHARR